MKAETMNTSVEEIRAELIALRMKRLQQREIQLVEQAQMRDAYYRRMEALKRKQRYVPIHTYSEALNEVFGSDMNSPLILSQQAKLCRAIHQNEILKVHVNWMKDFALDEARTSQRIVSNMVDERTSMETKLMSQIMLLSNEIANLKSQVSDITATNNNEPVATQEAVKHFKTDSHIVSLAPLVGDDGKENLLPQRVVCAAHAG